MIQLGLLNVFSNAKHTPVETVVVRLAVEEHILAKSSDRGKRNPHLQKEPMAC